jgi:lipoic acid synthetase
MPPRTLDEVTAAPLADGRRLLRVEQRNSQTPIERKPPWIKTRATMGPDYTELKSLVQREGLHTVCQEAGCPNIYECWEDREATFLIGGDQCTRRCDFCQIDTGKPEALDRDEPRRVAESVQAMGLRYATITGVARDDLPDGGAWLYAETVRQIHIVNSETFPNCSPRCSPAARRSSHTTSRPCPASSGASGRASAMSARWRCCAPPAPTGW